MTAALRLSPERALAATVAADWRLGFADVEEEFLLVPSGTGELDGWLVGTSLNLAARATEVHVFRAKDVAVGAVATWRAEFALPIGFHGTFVA